MARQARVSRAGYVYHVMNRGAFRQELFCLDEDYLLFQELIFKCQERIPIRICGYCIMPNHWHLALWPTDDKQLSRYMHLLTSTHVQKIKKYWKINSAGSIYQGRYKSCLVGDKQYYLNLVRYIESNPLRAKLCQRAEDWKWSSFSKRLLMNSKLAKEVFPSPYNLPKTWSDIVNEKQEESELVMLRKSVNKGSLYGSKEWISKTATDLGIEYITRPAGRPRNNS